MIIVDCLLYHTFIELTVYDMCVYINSEYYMYINVHVYDINVRISYVLLCILFQILYQSQHASLVRVHGN